MLVVTGAAGFIGSNLVAALKARGAVLSITESIKHELLERLAEGEPIEAVIHMGACSDTTATDREYVMATNYEYSCQLWTLCAARGIRLIYASSAATYGDGALGYDDKADPRALYPLNLYGESKQRFDLWALEQTLTPPAWAGLKFFNVYGPGEEHKGRMASVAYHLYHQIRKDGVARLFRSNRPDYPDGGQMRDFIYVQDVVAAVLHCLDVKHISGLFNVGTGIARSFNDLAHAVFTAMSLPPRIEYIPMPADLQARYQYFTQATTAKLRESGFTVPCHTLEAGVADYVAYLSAQLTQTTLDK